METIFGILASILTGSATAVLIFQLVNIQRTKITNVQEHDFESRRREEVRQRSKLFRWLEPWIVELSNWLESSPGLRSALGEAKIARYLKQGPGEIPWKPCEWIASHLVVSLIKLVVTALALSLLTSPLYGFLLGFGVFVFSFASAQNKLAYESRMWMNMFKQRLPYSIDLIALMMKAGATIQESLSVLVQENENHPIGKEFGIVLQQHSAGHALSRSFTSMHERMDDEDISEIVFTTNYADEYGTPMGDAFMRLAEQMRLRRSQRAERLVGEAQASLAFPSFLVFLGCLLIVVAPVTLSALKEAFEMFHG